MRSTLRHLHLIRGEQRVTEAGPHPLDLQPRPAIIEFDAVEQPADLRIVLDPDDDITEITEANNVLDTVGSR